MAAIVSLCLLPLGKGPSEIYFSPLSDASHFFLFGVFSLALFNILPRHRFRYAGFGTATVAGLIEIIQPYFSRSQSLTDFVNGALGAIIFLSALFLLCYRRNIYLCGLWLLTALATAWQVFEPSIKAIELREYQKQIFPLLSSLEDPREIALWKGIEDSNIYLLSSSELALSGSNSLAVRTGETPYGGAELKLYPTDFSDFESLSFAVFLTPADASKTDGNSNFEIRIDDEQDCENYEQRFNKTLKLRAGWNRISIPITEIENAPQTRKLNLKSISRILFFVDKQNSPIKRFVLDEVGLQGKSGAGGGDGKK